MSDYAGNITPAGVRRRRNVGTAALCVAIILIVVLAVADAPRATRLFVFIPFVIAALASFQSELRTCVVLGAAGKRETVSGGTCPLPESELPAVRARANKVLVLSLVTAVVATWLVWWVAGV